MYVYVPTTSQQRTLPAHGAHDDAQYGDDDDDGDGDDGDDDDDGDDGDDDDDDDRDGDDGDDDVVVDDDDDDDDGDGDAHDHDHDVDVDEDGGDDDDEFGHDYHTIALPKRTKTGGFRSGTSVFQCFPLLPRVIMYPLALIRSPCHLRYIFIYRFRYAYLYTYTYYIYVRIATYIKQLNILCHSLQAQTYRHTYLQP